MTPGEFASKWRGVETGERASAQSHFLDLCALLGQPGPTEADPKGEWYAFEKGAGKLDGGEGFADVWMRGHFAWEYLAARWRQPVAARLIRQQAERELALLPPRYLEIVVRTCTTLAAEGIPTIQL